MPSVIWGWFGYLFIFGMICLVFLVTNPDAAFVYFTFGGLIFSFAVSNVLGELEDIHETLIDNKSSDAQSK